jgi:hypothetical protein
MACFDFSPTTAESKGDLDVSISTRVEYLWGLAVGGSARRK